MKTNGEKDPMNSAKDREFANDSAILTRWKNITYRMRYSRCQQPKHGPKWAPGELRGRCCRTKTPYWPLFFMALSALWKAWISLAVWRRYSLRVHGPAWGRLAWSSSRSISSRFRPVHIYTHQLTLELSYLEGKQEHSYRKQIARKLRWGHSYSGN